MKLLKPNINVKVKASGNYLPIDCLYSNQDILALHPSTKILPGLVTKKLANQISKKYGFSERNMVRKPGESWSPEEVLGEDISKACLQKVYDPGMGDIEYFVHGTTTSSRYTGSQATSVLSTVGQKSTAIEMKAGCSTSLASLYQAVLGLKAGHSNAMVLCTETMSKLVNPEIRDTWFGLADGSACLWLEESDQADFRILGMTFGTDGQYVDMYTTQGKLPPNDPDMQGEGYVLSGNGDLLRKLSLEHYGKMIDLYKTEGLFDEITHLIPHQVNNTIITDIVNAYFDSDKLTVLRNNQEIGNIGGSSVLYTLTDSINKDLFKTGDKILMMSVGGGLSYSMHLWEKL